MTTDNWKPSRPDWRPEGWPNVKLNVADRKSVAQNLGEISLRIDPKNAPRGAREIMDMAGIDRIKKHRYFVFENRIRSGKKPGPPKKSDNEEPFVALAAAYVRLAKAAYKLENGLQKIDENDLNWKAYETSVFKGTSLTKDSSFTHDSLALTDIVAKYLTALEIIVRETSLHQAWEKLRTQPFDKLEVEQANEHESEATRLGRMAALIDMDRHGKQSPPSRTYFSGIRRSDGEVPSWALPTLPLGRAVYPVSMEVLRIPDELRREFSLESFKARLPDEYGDVGHDCSQQAQSWLRSLGWQSGWDIKQGAEWAEHDALDWEELTLHAVGFTRLTVFPRSNGVFAYRLDWQIQDSTGGDHKVLLDTATSLERLVSEHDYSAWSSICIDGADDYLGILCDPEDDLPRYLIRDWYCLEREWFGRYNIFEKNSLDDHDVEWFCQYPFQMDVDLPLDSTLDLPVAKESLLWWLLLHEQVEDRNAKFSRKLRERCEAIVRESESHYRVLEDNLATILDDMKSKE